MSFLKHCRKRMRTETKVPQTPILAFGLDPSLTLEAMLCRFPDLTLGDAQPMYPWLRSFRPSRQDEFPDEQKVRDMPRLVNSLFIHNLQGIPPLARIERDDVVCHLSMDTLPWASNIEFLQLEGLTLPFTIANLPKLNLLEISDCECSTLKVIANHQLEFILLRNCIIDTISVKSRRLKHMSVDECQAQEVRVRSQKTVFFEIRERNTVSVVKLPST